MTKGSIKIGTLFQIPIRVNYTWFIIFALVSVSFSTMTYPSLYPGWATIMHWVAGLLTSLILFSSVLVHELSHSLVSRAHGIPVEGITLFLFGGVASISEESAKPQQELLMAAAGPASSLALAALFGILALLSPAGTFFAGLFMILASINVSLAVFNMIPGFPLDGGRVLRSILWWTTNDMKLATRVATLIGQGFAILMIVGGLFVAIGLGAWSTGLWLAFIGWFLENAASQSYQQFLLREMLAGVSAGDLMGTECSRITDNPDLQTAVDELLLRGGQRCLWVVRDDQLSGLVTLHSIREIPKDRWVNTSLYDAMIPFDQIKTVNAQETALQVLRKMDEENINQIPVVDNGRLVGMITREHVLHFIRTKAELGL